MGRWKVLLLLGVLLAPLAALADDEDDAPPEQVLRAVEDDARPARPRRDAMVRPVRYLAPEVLPDEAAQAEGDVEYSQMEGDGAPLDQVWQFDAPAPATSSAEWLRSGCWYTQQSAVYMSRETNVRNSWILSHDFSSSLLPHYDNFLQIPLSFGFRPGLRSVIGRSLGRDDRNRNHAVEFTYLGLGQWKTAGSMTAFVPGGIFVDKTIDPSLTVPVFNSADSQSFQATSNFNSFELNYRVERRLARDQLVYTRDSTWVRRDSPSMLPALILGVRYVRIYEKLNYLSSSTIGNGSYDVQTSNNLVGPQAGFEWAYEGDTWHAGARGKVGGFVNWDSASTQVNILDLALNPLVPARNQMVNSSILAFVGEINAFGSYRIRPNFSLRASYDLMFVSNLALAQNQVTFKPSTPPEIADHHMLLFQGVSFGFEYNR